MPVGVKDKPTSDAALDANELNAAEGSSRGPNNTTPNKAESSLLGDDAGWSTNVSGQPKGGLKVVKAFMFGSPQRKIVSGLGIGGGVATGVILVMLAWVPAQKLASLLSFTNDITSASQNQVGDTVSQRLFSQYLSHHVIPGLVTGNCVSTNISRSCALVGPEQTYTAKLFRAWRDSNLEAKLYKNYGLEIVKTGDVGINIHIRSDRLQYDIFSGDYTPDRLSEFDNKIYSSLSNKNEVRRIARESVSGETKWKTMIRRYQVAKLLERKYGVRLCFVACEGRDKIDNWLLTNPIADRSRAAKAYIAQRVVGPFNESLALAMGCALDPASNCADPENSDRDGDKRTKFQTQLRDRAKELASSVGGSEKLEKLISESSAIKQKGITGYFLEKVLTSIGGETAAKIAGKAIPIVGTADLIAGLVGGAATLGPLYVSMYYNIHSQELMNTYAMYAAAQDEYKSGDMDSVTYGSFVDSLNADPESGNDQLGAESSRVYQAFLQSDNANGTLSSLFTPSVSAATNGCNDPADTGTLLCKEESVVAPDGAIKSIFGGMADFLNSTGLGPLANVWNGAVAAITGPITEAISKLPAVQALMSKTAELLQPIGAMFAEKLFPPIMLPDSSGSRKASSILGGGFISAQEGCINSGCQVVSANEYASASLAYLSEEQDSFKSQSLATRLFDTSDYRSLVSRVATLMPSSLPTISHSLQSITSTNFFSTLGSSLSRLFSPRASAAPSSGVYAAYFGELGATTYGYPANDELLTTNDYAAYETTHQCDNPDTNMNWGNSTVYNDKTGQYDHTTTNGCLELRAMSCSLGGIYDSTLCDYAVQGDQTATPTTSSSSAATSSFTSDGNMQDLAKQVLASPNISLGTQFDNPSQQIKNIANGTNTPDCVVDPSILKLILYIAQSHTLTVSSLSRRCHEYWPTTYSYHYLSGGGHAVDFSSFDGVKATGSSDKEIEILKDLFPLLPQGTQVGQSDCRSAAGKPLVSPSTISQIPDGCSHTHIGIKTW